jgi:hypothetical protein
VHPNDANWDTTKYLNGKSHPPSAADRQREKEREKAREALAIQRFRSPSPVRNRSLKVEDNTDDKTLLRDSGGGGETERGRALESPRARGRQRSPTTSQETRQRAETPRSLLSRRRTREPTPPNLSRPRTVEKLMVITRQLIKYVAMFFFQTPSRAQHPQFLQRDEPRCA